MLYKDDISALDVLISNLADEPVQGYRIDDICRLTGKPYRDIHRTVEHLVSEGFVSQDIGLFGINLNKYEVDVYRLTEQGKFYKKVLRHQRVDYFLSKWTDILACIIALISLIVSIHTSLSN